MNGVALALTLATLGVNYSTRTTEEGEIEYTIQIEPEFLASLAEGEEIHSDVPPEVGNVQRVCIRIGLTPVRHTAASVQQFKRLLVAAPRYASTDPALAGGEALRTILWPGRSNPEESFGVDYGWQPQQGVQLEYFVQIDSTTLKTLAPGDEIHAAVEPAVGRVGRFVISSGNKQLPRVAPPPTEVAAVTPLPAASNRTRFQTGDDAGIVQPAEKFRTGEFNASATQFGASRQPAGSDLRAPAVAPQAGGYGGAGTLLESPRVDYNQPSASRPPATYNPPRDNTLADSRGYNPAPPLETSGGRFDQFRTGTLQPPSDLSQQPTYVQPAQAEQPQYQQPQYQQPTTRYSPPVANDRYASAPTTNTGAGLPPRTTEASLPAASLPAATLTTPLAKDQWWWPYWLFLVFSLFLSIGGNLYLGWTAAEFYSRYRLAVDRLRTAGRA